jgi:hypothetical protein
MDKLFQDSDCIDLLVLIDESHLFTLLSYNIKNHSNLSFN